CVRTVGRRADGRCANMCAHRRRLPKWLSRAVLEAGACKRNCSGPAAVSLEPPLAHARNGHAGPRPPGSNLNRQMAVTLSDRRRIGPIVARSRRRKLMEKFVIEGGAPLSGTMVPAGNKNGALPILASCVLTDEEVVVRNVPRIRDVDAMLEILRGLGVEVSW